MAEFIDALGKRTAAGNWKWFITVTFRTPSFPWMRGFPFEQPEPSADFVHHFFDWIVRWIEREVHHRVEYFVADQFGEIGGRIHLHCGLSWPGLFEYRWKSLQKMLCDKAGWNKILPWERDAGYYIGRYIGRDAHRAHWDWSVGQRHVPSRPQPPIGRQVIAISETPDENSSRGYRQTAGAWHR